MPIDKREDVPRSCEVVMRVDKQPVRPQRKHAAGFSMLELVMVLIILGIIAAIAVPRMSRASQGAAEVALKQDLTVLRNALDMFGAEHNAQLPDAQFVMMALFAYSNSAGTMFSPTRTETFYLGPYLRFPPPTLPVGRRKGHMSIEAADGIMVGWIYDKSAGTIRANCDDDEVDATGTPYNKY